MTLFAVSLCPLLTAFGVGGKFPVMAMAQRKSRDGGQFVPSLTVFDFLPVYLYRTNGGRGPWDLFVNWPLLVACSAGYLLARWLH